MTNIINLFNTSEDLAKIQDGTQKVKYEIVSIADGYKNTNSVNITVQVKGTSKTFIKSIEELYQKKWLDEFCREDVAYLGFLYAAEKSDNLPLIEYFPRKKPAITTSVILLGMLFSAFLILSNVTAFKISEIKFLHYSINFPSALIFFPLTYFFDDTLTEVYGFKISRLIIWGGLICSTVFTLGSAITVYLPVSTLWDINTNHAGHAYKLIFQGSSRIFISSILAYFCGEFLNSIILAKLKVLTAGKHFYMRVIGSTLIGVGIDSIIFCNIAFLGIMPYAIIWNIILTQYCFKLFYEIIMLPATYVLTNFLKKVDKVDHYDFHTRFNPFSLRIVD